MPETYIMPGNIKGEISENNVIYFGLRGELGYHLDDIFLYIIEKHYFPQDADKRSTFASNTDFREIFNKKIQELNKNKCLSKRPNYLSLNQAEIDDNYNNRIPSNGLPYSGLKIPIQIPTLSEMLQYLPIHSLHREAIPLFSTIVYNPNKVVLVGYDINDKTKIETFQTAANQWIRNKNYIKISPSKENKVPKNKNTRHLTDNMRNTVFYSGKAALDAIRDHAIGKSPITEIYFSTHGTVYAIDFNNPPNNLYTSESNMLELAGPTWKLGESGKFIRHLKYYYDTGILSLSVTIAMGACLTGAQVVNIEKVIKDAKREKNDRFYIDLTNTLEKQYQQFVTLNKDKFKPENFAYLLSKELPGATIIAPTIRSSANRGIECPVMYQNCLRWEIMLPDHYLGIERDNTLSWLTGSMKTTLHPMPIL